MNAKKFQLTPGPSLEREGCLSATNLKKLNYTPYH
jgi:hypothetical protein